MNANLFILAQSCQSNRPWIVLGLLMQMAWSVWSDGSFAAEKPVHRSTSVMGYVVKMVQAPVSYRCFDHGDWLDLKRGLRVPFGCLLQVREGGVAILVPPKSSGNMTPQDLQITTPVVLRLTADVLRETSVSQRFLRSAKNAAKSYKPMGTLYQLEEAWKKLAISLQIPKAPEGVEFVQFNEVEKNISLMTQEANMEMYYPDNDSIHTKQEQPYQVKVRWSETQNRKNFDVYVWPAREQRGKPHARTSGNVYELPIYNSGSYFVQVVAEDKKWQTSPHLFHVKQDDPGSVNSSQSKPLPFDLTILFPRDNTLVLTGRTLPSTELALVDFSWVVPASANLSANRLIIESLDQQKLKKEVNLSHSMTKLALPPGKYLWSLQFLPSISDPESSPYVSEQYSLEIKPATSSLFADVIIDPKDSQRTIYFNFE